MPARPCQVSPAGFALVSWSNSNARLVTCIRVFFRTGGRERWAWWMVMQFADADEELPLATLPQQRCQILFPRPTPAFHPQMLLLRTTLRRSLPAMKGDVTAQQGHGGNGSDDWATSRRPEGFIASELEKYGEQVVFAREEGVAARMAGAADDDEEEWDEEEGGDDIEDDMMWFDGHEGVTGNFTKTFKAEVSGHRPNSAATQQAKTPPPPSPALFLPSSCLRHMMFAFQWVFTRHTPPQRYALVPPPRCRCSGSHVSF